MQLPCTKQCDAAELSRCRTSWGGPTVPKGPCSPPDPPLPTWGNLWESNGRWLSATAEPLRRKREFICMPAL